PRLDRPERLRQLLAVEPGEPRLRVKGIDVRRPAGHEQEDDALGPGFEVGLLRRERVGLGEQLAFLGEHGREGERAESATGSAEEGAAVGRGMKNHCRLCSVWVTSRYIEAVSPRR